MTKELNVSFGVEKRGGGRRAGVIRQSSALGGSGWRTSLKSDSGFFRPMGAFEQFRQFCLGGPARPVEPQGFDGAQVGSLSGPQHQQQGGNEHTVNLDAGARRRFGQPMPAIEDGFDPLE